MVSEAGAKVGGREVHFRQAAEPGGGKHSPLSLPNRAEPSTAADACQRPLCSRFQARLSASVGRPTRS